MEFFSQLVCFSKFYVVQISFQKNSLSNIYLGFFLINQKTWLYKDSKLMYFIGILELMTRNISNIFENFAI